MALATLLCRAQLGMEAPLVKVEVDIGNGLPSFGLVGLPDAAVREAKERVRSALLNCGFEFPARRITINLAPAELPKDGGRFDLAMALGILAASGQLPAAGLKGLECYGELGLGGELRPCGALLPALLACRDAGHSAIISEGDGAEAALLDFPGCAQAHQLLDVCAALGGQQQLALPSRAQQAEAPAPGPDLSDVVGQVGAKRALLIAASGNHNLLMVGPPGTGKSMLAKRLPSLLPPLADGAALETAAIHSLSGKPRRLGDWRTPPIRAPHHTASAVALVGGGSVPRPGEISLAHQGVLFLDELTEYDRKVLDCLREPLESGEVSISRAAQQANFPARFMLVAATNPCPCGHWGNPARECRCSPEQIRRYLGRLSGPFLDRVELQVEVPMLPPGALSGQERGQGSAELRARVGDCRRRQRARQHCLNGELEGQALRRHCALDGELAAWYEQTLHRLGLSARVHQRLLKVARTVADLDGSDRIRRPHLAEALSYRAMDRLLASLA
ncbi:YifB family Mg chelatase-like AAA ATPase [Gallaecimonas sp. GXIMD4217]|uniref:YifB family Mg chelatase-like AAA ATPase n=1 Tax=Gallaecimonas sp. GXIMD4217 TaxID=3131927 RepID=UPI00311B148D